VTLGRILVVDDDPWIQRSAATALGQRGYQVSLAGDAQGAFAVASKVRPDLIFTSVSLPAIEGWSWWERLRTLPACADTPIVFLLSVLDSSTEVRGAGPRDQRLRKPFRVEDLERAIVTSLGVESVQAQVSSSTSSKLPLSPNESSGASAVKPSAGHRPLSAVRGQVDQIGLSSILAVLEMERKTGILLIERTQGTARLFLRKGRIIRADTEEPRLAGAAAVYESLTWNSGAFDFLTGDIGGVDEIQASTTFLLMEAARRFDEANERRLGPAEGLASREGLAGREGHKL
jgi:two-component system OmpR family response regulator